MRYVLFSLILTALFLTACADPDNPVVYTAPAGKAVADEDEEVKQPPSPNFGSDVVVPPSPVDPPVTAQGSPTQTQTGSVTAQGSPTQTQTGSVTAQGSPTQTQTGSISCGNYRHGDAYEVICFMTVSDTDNYTLKVEWTSDVTLSYLAYDMYVHPIFGVGGFNLCGQTMNLQGTAYDSSDNEIATATVSHMMQCSDSLPSLRPED